MNSDVRNRDTGMVIVLVALILFNFFSSLWLFWFGVSALLLNMTVPGCFGPFAKLWFRLADLLSSFMSTFILCLLYICIVCPVSLMMKIFGHDPLAAKKWKKGKGSLFCDMDNDIASDYFDKPY